MRRVVFIDTGLVEVSVSGRLVTELGDGSYLGEISALEQCGVVLRQHSQPHHAHAHAHGGGGGGGGGGGQQPPPHPNQPLGGVGSASASVRAKDVCYVHVLQCHSTVKFVAP